MKKIIALLTAGIVMASSTVAFADEEIKVTQKCYYPNEGSGMTYFFAKIENVGDVPVYLDSGNLVIFDTNDELIETSEYVLADPRYLEPGESTYAVDWSFEDVYSENVGDVKFSIKTENYSYPIERLPYVEARYDAGKPDSSYDDYVYVTYINDSEDTISRLHVVAVVSDEEGNIIYVGNTVLSDVIIYPESKIDARIDISNSMVDYMTSKKITPQISDVIVYIEED